MRGIRRGENGMEDLVNLWESDDIKYEIKTTVKCGDGNAIIKQNINKFISMSWKAETSNVLGKYEYLTNPSPKDDDWAKRAVKLCIRVQGQGNSLIWGFDTP